MQQPFCADALMDFFCGNGIFIWGFTFVVLIKYITLFRSGSLFLSLILAFLCVLLLCLKNSYYVWFSCWLFWCNCKPTIYNCWPAILKSWRGILKSWCRMRRLLLVGDWLFFQSQIHIPSTSPKQSIISLAPCFL